MIRDRRSVSGADRPPGRLVGTAVTAMIMGVATAPPVDAAEIKAAVIALRDGFETGGVFELPLERYWRGNMTVDAEELRDDKVDFPHVPNLIEYRVDVKQGGRYELQARYTVEEPGPASLTLDGKPVGTLFSERKDTGETWATLATFGLRPQRHRLRFTSHYVETPFPVVRGLRLKFLGGDVPPPEPEPVVKHPRPEMPADWFKSISRKIHGDFHTAGFIRGVGKDFDGDEYADTLARSGVNAICVFAKGLHGYAYYDTRIGTRHPGLDFDLMQAQIEACHERGIAIWTYFVIGRDELYTSTMEQEIADPHDRSVEIDAAIDSIYVRDCIWPMIEEVVRGYDVDGIFMDFPGSEAFVEQTTRLIKDLKPGLVIAYNHQWTTSRAGLDELDVLEIESWRHKQTLYHWQATARYARGAVPMTAMTIRFWKAWGDFGGLADAAMLRYQAATAQANGCAITIGDHLHPFGRLNPAVYERIGPIFREAARLEPYVLDSGPVPYVALARIEEDLLTTSGTSIQALIDGGVAFMAVDATQELAPFAAVVVPDIAKVDAEYQARLEAYVEGGGRLLAMGRPGEAMARLLGVRVEEQAEAGYIRVRPEVLPTPPAMDLYTYAGVTPVTPLEGTDVVAPLVWPLGHGTIHRSRRQSPPAEEASGFAAITSRRHGRGQAVYVGAPLCEIYATWGYTPMRQILTDLIHRMIPAEERLVEVAAPVPLEVTLNRLGEKYVVHVVHCPQSRRSTSAFDDEALVNREPMIDGVPTVSGAVVHLPRRLTAGKHIRLLAPEGAQLSVGRDADGRVRVEVPDFEIRAVVLIE